MLILFVFSLLFVLPLLFGSLSVFIILEMKKGNIKKKKNRARIVRLYKTIIACSHIFMAISVGVLLLFLYIWLYKMILYVIMFISNNFELSEYIALSTILITFHPSMYYLLKIVKKDLYKKIEQKEMQDVITERINKIIIYINELPIKGIIHIVNLILVILVNSFKILNIDTNITTTCIYMSIATFYALDRAVDYFIKKYSDFWKKIDNKLFNTEKIDSNVNFELNDLKNINEVLFSNYIETGIYEIPEECLLFSLYFLSFDA